MSHAQEVIFSDGRKRACRQQALTGRIWRSAISESPAADAAGKLCIQRGLELGLNRFELFYA